MFETLRNYWRVAKPGIIFANLISSAGGFCLASRGQIDSPLLAWTLTGTALMVASACVFNNCIDRDIDRKMTRTRHRVLAQGRMSPTVAVIYGTLLGSAGATLLLFRVNGITLVAVLSGFAVYVGLYSLYLKRSSTHAAVVGSLAGAAPPVAGYCAASGRFDLGALLLAAIFSFWQIPHAYAIAVLRREEYAAAGIPVLPVRCGTHTAKKHIVAYVLAFIAGALLLAIGGYVGHHYFAVAAALGLLWLIMALSGFRTTNDRLWARNVYAFSILTIAILSIMMSVDAVNPLNTDLWLTYLP
jgi:protoheme IX farnesyltransferase